MTKNVCILGDGGWGTALALLLHENGHRVRVWGPFQGNIENIRNDRENRLFLPGVPLPADLEWTHERQAAVENADLIVLVVPSKYYKDVLQSFQGLIPPKALLVSATKGLEHDTLRCMSAIAEETLKRPAVAALSGPSHAEEVARRIPTAVTIASTDLGLAEELQEVFTNRRFRVYTSDDILGVELGGALKNVVAVAVGVSDGLGFGDNTRAALITRGLAEISRLGTSVGARKATFFGLSGMGDLIATCTSRHSRNRSVGERIGKGESAAEIMAGMQQAVEGIWTCSSARALARRQNIDVPITDEVYEIVNSGKDPADAVISLMERELKTETP